MSDAFKKGLLELLRTLVIGVAIAVVEFVLNNLAGLNLSPVWIMVLTPVLKGLDEWLGEKKVGFRNYGLTGF